MSVLSTPLILSKSYTSFLTTTYMKKYPSTISNTFSTYIFTSAVMPEMIIRARRYMIQRAFGLSRTSEIFTFAVYIEPMSTESGTREFK